MNLTVLPPADDPGHVAGLSGTFHVQKSTGGRDPFEAGIGKFLRQTATVQGCALERRIMPPEEWIESPYHSGPFSLDFLWPEKKKAFIEAARGDVTVVILTGSLGTGKTALLDIISLYDAYRLSCFSSPQAFLGLPVTSKLVTVFISLSKTKAIEKLFDPFKMAVDATPYFQNECPRDRNLESVVRFPSKNIEFRPGVTGEAAIHSEDVRGVGLSEANFLPIIAQSLKKRGGESLDVAQDIVTQGLRRMESRFLQGGRLQLCRIILDSSRQYPDDFVERMERQALAGEAQYPTKVFSFSQWEAKKGVRDAEGKLIYSGETFPVEVGSGNRASHILDDSEVAHATGRVVWCAVEHRESFVLDVDGSLRDLAGIAVEGLRPLIPQKEMLIECIRAEDEGYAPHQCRHPFTALTTTLRDAVDFIQEVLVNPQTRRPWVNPDRMRAVHADPSVVGDAFGLAMGHVSDVVTVNRLVEGRGDTPCQVCLESTALEKIAIPLGRIACPRCGGKGFMVHFGSKQVRCHGCRGEKVVRCPACRGSAIHGTPLERVRTYLDLVLRITPPKSGRIMFDDVEALLDKLRGCGFMIGMVTADGHQSEFFLQRQLTRPWTLRAERLSVDVKKDPYYALRDAVMDVAADGRRRLSFYDYQPLFDELRRVEDRRDKIDHVANGGSKDVSDAAAGVVYNCETVELLRESVVTGSLDVAQF